MHSSRALVSDGTHFTVVDQKVEAPVGRPLRVLRVGLCGTDLQIARRVRPDPARVLGHEGVAEATVPGEPPRTVIINPVDPANQDSILGHSYDGLLQDLLEPPGTARGFGLVPARAKLPLDLGCLTEPLATALYGWDAIRASVAVDRAVVYGSGPAGLLVGIAGALNGTDIRVVGRDRVRMARLGELLAPADLPLACSTEDVRAGWADGAFVCVPREGADAALTAALRSVRPGGGIDLFGGFAVGDRHAACVGTDLGAIRRLNACGNPSPLVSRPIRTTDGKLVLLTGHRGCSPAQLDRAQQLLLDHARLFGSLITSVVSLERAADLLTEYASGHRAELAGHIKTIVDLTFDGQSREVDLSNDSGAILRLERDIERRIRV